MKSRQRSFPAEPWSPALATEQIRAKACEPSLKLCVTDHTKEQMARRGLIMGDILCVLENGFVYEQAQQATRKGVFKYLMDCSTPNSGRRLVRVVVIPHPSPVLKIVTVMWVYQKSIHKG